MAGPDGVVAWRVTFLAESLHQAIHSFFPAPTSEPEGSLLQHPTRGFPVDGRGCRGSKGGRGSRNLD